MRWPLPEGVRSVEVIRLSSLGDVLLCEPAVAALAARYPDAVLSVVTREDYRALFEHHPAVRAVRTPAEARSGPRPDLAVDLHNRASTRALAARARHRRHWRKRRGLDLLRGLAGRPMAGGHGGPHQVARMMAALALGPPRAPVLHVDAAALATAASTGPAGAVVLLPAAAHPLKAWPVEGYAALAERLVDQGQVVQVAGGPGEEALLARVAGRGARILPTAWGLDVLGAALGRAALVIGNDTGLAHLAAAAGAPTLSLFGPTSVGRWAPWSGRGQVLQHPLPCSPCSDHGAGRCHLGDRPCLVGIDVAEVLAGARAQLERDPLDDPSGLFLRSEHLG